MNCQAMLNYLNYCHWQQRRTEEVNSVWRDSAAKSGPKPQQLVTRKHDEISRVSEIPPSKLSTYMDTLPIRRPDYLISIRIIALDVPTIKDSTRYSLILSFIKTRLATIIVPHLLLDYNIWGLLVPLTIVIHGGGSSLVKGPGDVPPPRVPFFGLLV